jgi:predicted class III extradiol MEMO1 family dioxygenase
LGNLKLDLNTISELHETGQFDVMSHSVDEAEHSIEMQLPYTAKMLSR